MLLLLFVLSLTLSPIQARAHNRVVHEKLVNDAIFYIRNHGTPTQKAALNELVRLARGEENLRQEIAEEARLADEYEDLAYFSNSKSLAFVVPFVTGDRTFFKAQGHYITRLQHFLNVTHDPERWKGKDGYYYQWTAKDGQDRSAMSSGGWGPVDVSAADLEVDNEYSIALPRYQTHWNGTSPQWARNWEYDFNLFGDDWDIENTRFAPVSALAYYWFRRYAEFRNETARTQYGKFLIKPHQPPVRLPPRKINGAQLLGPVLHAAGDVTVPQHAMGTNALGHTTYEDDFERLYLGGQVPVSVAGIEQHLNSRDFLKWGLAPVSAQPDRVGTLQVTVVTGDQDGDGTDANISIDFGSGQEYKLNTDMDDFERWNDDTFTLAVKANTRVSDLNRVRIRRDSNGSPWKLRALYVMVNGVLLYGNPNINRLLAANQDWSAADFLPRNATDKEIWPVDKVMIDAALYTYNYILREFGEQRLRSAAHWEEAYRKDKFLFAAGELEQKKQRMQHLLDLAVATIVRTIEMSQMDRGLLDSSSGMGFYRQKDHPEVSLVYKPGLQCHVQNDDQMTAFGGFWRVKILERLNLSGRNTGDCGFPNGFFRLSNRPEVFRLYGSGIPELDIGDRFCHVTTEAQMNAYGGFSQVRVVHPGSNLGRGRTFTNGCPNP